MFSFDNYIKIQGQIEYILMLHCLRMVMLVKLINKSHNLKYQERINKQYWAEHSAGDAGIELDLF